MSGKLAIIACPYSGTRYTTKILNACGLEMGHEKIGADGIVSWKHAHLKRQDFIDLGLSPDLTILQQVRHPLMTISSILVLPHNMWELVNTYAESMAWHPADTSNILLRSMQLWYYWNKLAEETADHIYAVEEIPFRWEWFISQTGLNDDVEHPRIGTTDNRHSNRSNQRKICSWNNLYDTDSKLTLEILEMAKRYNYTQVPVTYMNDKFYEVPDPCRLTKHKPSSVLIERRRANPDRTLRCYLTLDCRANCGFCSANIPAISRERKSHTISPETWAEGINRRNRPTILAGGEPFLYEGLPELINLIDPRIRIEIYTNLEQSVDHYLEIVDRPLSFLISFHPSVKDKEEWASRIDGLAVVGNSIRFHVVKKGDWQERVEYLIVRFDGRMKITACDDQRTYPKSKGAETNEQYPSVKCMTQCYSYGSLGYRYKCATLMGKGGQIGRYEHISEPDSEPEMTLDRCTQYGLCAACDNLLAGKVVVA